MEGREDSGSGGSGGGGDRRREESRDRGRDRREEDRRRERGERRDSSRDGSRDRRRSDSRNGGGDSRRRERDRSRDREGRNGGNGRRDRSDSRNGGAEGRQGGNGRDSRFERVERVSLIGSGDGPARREEDGGRRRRPSDFQEERSPGGPSKRRRGDDDPDGPQPGPSHRMGERGGYGERGRGGFGGGRGDGRGRGRGGGRGRGRGGRGGRQQREEPDQFDLVVSRPVNPQGHRQVKRAVITEGIRAVALKGNFFGVLHRPNWCIYHYRVDFEPDEADTRIKKQLLRPHNPVLGANLFDGSSLYSSQRLHPDPMELTSIRDPDQQQILLKIRLVAEVQPTDPMYLQFFNILVRKCLELLGLQEMGRHFYDFTRGVTIPTYQLELWPGFKTSMRNHEHDILLGVELTHKVLRQDNCLQVMQNLNFDRRKIKDQLVGCIVMTIYNRKTYRCDDIEWTKSPLETFDQRGKKVTLAEYYQTTYNITIHDTQQPMLVSRPKKKDFHRGTTGPIMLVPELCKMTGLSDPMRNNFQLMKAVSAHMLTDPAARVDKLQDFMRRLRATTQVDEELSRWGLKFDNKLVSFEGHVIKKETIVFGEKQGVQPNEFYDWNHGFRNKKLLRAVPLKTWVIIVPSVDAQVVNKLVKTMQSVATPLDFFICQQSQIYRVSSLTPMEYAKAVDQAMAEYKDKMQMIFAILPRQTTDLYAAVKKRACAEFGVPSQCFVAKNAKNERGIMSVCSKLVVQMCAKMGGEPWGVIIPLKKMMVVGFDVHHCGKRKGASISATVATTNDTCTKYFSCTSSHTSKEDLSSKMATDFSKCLIAYQKINECLPERVLMYRDGVGDGQLKYVYETELKMILNVMESQYKQAGREIPKFTFIVVNRRINTRIFADDGRGRPVNPEPGTVADDVVTLPERYDFFLISQHSKQGTVSPVAYNVLHDTSGLSPDRMQRITFKLCHLYFNWSGTIAVPAPCQYAHKLSYLTGTAVGQSSHEKLSNLLYFL